MALLPIAVAAAVVEHSHFASARRGSLWTDVVVYAAAAATAGGATTTLYIIIIIIIT